MSRLIVRGALAVLLLLPAAAHAQVPDPGETAIGVSVNRVFGDQIDAELWDRHAGYLSADGIRLARADAFWDQAEPAPPQNGAHTYDWTTMDLRAATLARHGIRWLPILDYSVPWASSDAGDDVHAPPDDNADYAAYAASFARRYGRGGTFWAENPELPALPVTTYEIWNEPNLKWFWLPAPDPALYADMYIRARDAIKATDPSARVVTGGLTPDGADDYVRAMYAARPELHGHVDGVGLHPYSRSAAGVFARVRSMRATLESLGEGAVPMHLTELGWVTSGEGSPLVVSEADRAVLLEITADLLVRSDCGVASVVAYTWTTPEQNPANAEDWYGIVHPDGTRTPSSEALRRVAARYDAAPPDPARPHYVCKPEPVLDSDGDGIGDPSDFDDDNDGIPDALDAFPLDRGEWFDIDGDGRGDNADPDDDGDGLLDAAEARAGTSPTDIDSDDDGLSDGAERRTDPARADTDRDGLADGLESGRTAGLADPPTLVSATDRLRFKPDRDPRTRTRATTRDSDRDGLSDGHEDGNRNGKRNTGETDPYKRDTDGDRVNDRRDRRPLDRRRH